MGSKTRNQLMSIHGNRGRRVSNRALHLVWRKCRTVELALSVILNPQLKPQNAMSYTTSASFGSPRGCCKSL